MEHERPQWRVYTTREAADILRVPVGQVVAAIRRGDIASFRVGKHVRITDAALREFTETAAAA